MRNLRRYTIAVVLCASLLAIVTGFADYLQLPDIKRSRDQNLPDKALIYDSGKVVATIFEGIAANPYVLETVTPREAPPCKNKSQGILSSILSVFGTRSAQASACTLACSGHYFTSEARSCGYFECGGGTYYFMYSDSTAAPVTAGYKVLDYTCDGCQCAEFGCYNP